MISNSNTEPKINYSQLSTDFSKFEKLYAKLHMVNSYSNFYSTDNTLILINFIVKLK